MMHERALITSIDAHIIGQALFLPLARADDFSDVALQLAMLNLFSQYL